MIIDGLTFDNVIGDIQILKLYGTSDDLKYDSLDKESLNDGTVNNNTYDIFDYVIIKNNSKGYNYTLYDADYFDDVYTEGVSFWDWAL